LNDVLRGNRLTLPASKKTFSLLILALLSVATLLGLLRLRAAQDSTLDFAKRDVWQRPNEVMDELGIKEGTVVADVGCGSGYFVFHLAQRVGPKGKVYAEDIESGVLSKIDSRIHEENLEQIEVIQGTPDDPFLPAGTLDVVIIVNAYHEMKNFDGMLQSLYRALMPGGVLGIIDHEAEPGQPRSDYQEHHRIPEQMVRDDLARNAFHFLSKKPGFESTQSGKKYFFLIFEKPRSANK
jgi:predicted methyltransferase